MSDLSRRAFLKGMLACGVAPVALAGAVAPVLAGVDLARPGGDMTAWVYYSTPTLRQPNWVLWSIVHDRNDWTPKAVDWWPDSAKAVLPAPSKEG